MYQRNRVRHDHFCDVFHRPLGVYEVKYSQNQLVRDTCPILFKSKRLSTFENSLFPNYNLSEVNIKKKHWKIDSKESIDTRYWIWVLNRFQLEFESQYSASPRADNSDTQFLTKNEILRKSGEVGKSAAMEVKIVQDSLENRRFNSCTRELTITSKSFSL